MYSYNDSGLLAIGRLMIDQDYYTPGRCIAIAAGSLKSLDEIRPKDKLLKFIKFLYSDKTLTLV